MIENKVSNRLINEESPYLLQHAYNPVNWFPWGKEAFESAKEDNKPIFLSIGYSTCHWCHVMAHESFEDCEVAEMLNKYFICIKVDREERPDIDNVYMSVCQAITGSGGWPLTIIMTPDQKPFWAGTYLPKKSAYGRIGLLDLLDAVKKQWVTNRKDILESSEKITDFLKTSSNNRSYSEELNEQILKDAVEMFRQNYDSKWGGFSGAPKFPVPHNLLFLLRYSVLENDKVILNMVEHTLTQMFRGGMFDHIGGGFSRYSTDKMWLVPHFEKMLYDNALLVYTYSEAFKVTGNQLYKAVAERTINYVLNELTDEKGGFYCGQDADSGGIEGEYYVFGIPEIIKVLGETDGSYFIKWFGASEKGNFEGKNIFNLIDNPNYDETNSSVEEMSKKIYDYRLSRNKLHKDDKVLTSWNSLMIAALAKAGRVFHNSDYMQSAKNAQQFIENNLIGEDGELKVRWRNGNQAYNGQLDDYAFYAFSLLEMYMMEFDVYYLKRAKDITDRMIELFFDSKDGGFYFYSSKSEQLISRPKEVYDGAMPSGNSVAAFVLERLNKLTGESKYKDISEKHSRYISGVIKNQPIAYSMSLIAAIEVLYPSKEVICVSSNSKFIPNQLINYLDLNISSNLSVILKNNENSDKLGQVAPFTSDYPIPDNGDMYYICQNGCCSAPIDHIEI